MTRAEQEQERLQTAYSTRQKALSFGDSGASSMQNWRSQYKSGVPGSDGPWCGFSKQLNIGNMHEHERWPYGSRQLSRLPSAYDMDDADVQKLAGSFNAREQCTVRVKTGDFASRAVSKDFSASPISEGVPTFSGLLPPVLLPDAPVFYIYDNEPRLMDFIPSIAIETEEVALPVEQYPTNPGAVSFLEEGGTFADIGSSWESMTFRPKKVGALGSVTTEAAEDEHRTLRGTFKKLFRN